MLLLPNLFLVLNILLAFTVHHRNLVVDMMRYIGSLYALVERLDCLDSLNVSSAVDRQL